MSNRQQKRESLIKSIIGQVSREIDGVLGEAELSDDAREKIKNDVVANTERILDACSIDELQSSTACQRYLRSCAQDARIEINRRRQ